MAGAPTDKIPLHTIVLPVLGLLAWLLIGKVGLGLLAILVAAFLLGNVVAAVHHAEVVALRVGEPLARSSSPLPSRSSRSGSSSR